MKLSFKIGACLLIFFLIVIMAIGGSEGEKMETPQIGVGKISSAVAQYEPVVREELAKYDLEEHTGVLLAIIMQESGGTSSLDIMQASESLGLPMNTIQDPIYSIEVGVKHFASVINQAEENGVDFNTALQAYNFGTGYIGFVAQRGGTHTKDLATEFSGIHAAKQGWDRYGDINYIDNIMRYANAKGGNGRTGNAPATFEGDLAQLQSMWEQYEGMPYNFGGQSPATSFDCSGLWFYLFGQMGINIPRTAQEQYNYATEVSQDDLQPGDFVFFHSTYDTPNYITHLGIYVGDGMMFHAGDPLQYTSIETPFWQQHFAGYGRIVDFNS